jgi:hypothetical protein
VRLPPVDPDLSLGNAGDAFAERSERSIVEQEYAFRARPHCVHHHFPIIALY